MIIDIISGIGIGGGVAYVIVSTISLIRDLRFERQMEREMADELRRRIRDIDF